MLLKRGRPMNDKKYASTRGAQAPDRRHFVAAGAVALTAAVLPSAAAANVPVPYDWNASPPMDARTRFIEWMSANRGENPDFLSKRWDRFQQLLAQRDIWDERDKRAYLLTPREEFVTIANLNRAYVGHYLPIGYGVTITDPQTVARMTNSINVKLGDKVLEVGTGSGYQSAYLSNLTEKLWSIEIIKPLAERTRTLYD
jgi:protein-L-isoaspartate(D-aspartate) O-methyltransferase